MGMPKNLVMFRHGESEGNVAQRMEKLGLESDIAPEVYKRHDWEHPLSQDGIGQAIVAGEYGAQEFGDFTEYFDRRYVSPFIRTRQTAAYIGGMACDWIIDNRLIERNWGVYGATPLSQRAELFPQTDIHRDQSTLYAQYDNGESIGYQALYRVRDWLGTLHRDANRKNVAAVTHGEFMWTARFVIENLLPEEWEKLEKDKSQKMRNCAMLHYTRINPMQPGSPPEARLRWRRIVYPDKPEESPYGGEWQEFEGKRYMTGRELLESV